MRCFQYTARHKNLELKLVATEGIEKQRRRIKSRVLDLFRSRFGLYNSQGTTHCRVFEKY